MIDKKRALAAMYRALTEDDWTDWDEPKLPPYIMDFAVSGNYSIVLLEGPKYAVAFGGRGSNDDKWYEENVTESFESKDQVWTAFVMLVG